MIKLVKKFVPVLLVWGVFVYVLLNTPYPKDLSQATTPQLIFFFTPLFLAIIFTLNLYLNYLPVSISVSLGLVILLILKALNILNLVTILLTLTTAYLFASYFWKERSNVKSHPNLTSRSNIPKLRIHKRNLLKFFRRNHG
ncbi:hypothetical protein HYW42_01500 [Candidatus Daviesbacteria bacterium]|nr:hypothetical protein [Candidatus Daviesbacteria bacterium]